MIITGVPEVLWGNRQAYFILRCAWGGAVDFSGRVLLCFVGVLLFSAQASADLKSAALAYQQGKFDAAIKEARPLAEGGNTVAQYLLGSALANAKSPLGNVLDAESWLRKSATQGNVSAMLALGNLNLFLKNPNDTTQAIEWLTAAANRGDPESQHMLAVIYLSGEFGVQKDSIQGYFWLYLASSRGHVLSAVMLDVMPEKPDAEQAASARLKAQSWRPSW